MTCGGCLCIPSDAARKDDIAGSIKAMDATFIHLTSSVARLINPSAVPSLATFVLIDEPMTQEDAAAWSSKVALYNDYGPAECTPSATLATVNPDVKHVGSIGRGLGLVTWVVCRGGLQLASLGAVGELWLKGPLVGQGYLHDPEKTAAAFIEDPPWLLRGGHGHPGRRGRLYRTGDLVRYDTDGSLIFIRRIDNQIKIRGQWVELGEVEDHVRRGLAESGMNAQVIAEVITSVENPNPMLAAFANVRQAAGQSIGKAGAMLLEVIGSLEKKLTDSIPAYMIPALYIPMAEFPMTRTGKTDRRKLRKIGGSMTLEQLATLRPSQGERRPPSTEVERQLQGLWATVLGIEAQIVQAASHH